MKKLLPMTSPLLALCIAASSANAIPDGAIRQKVQNNHPNLNTANLTPAQIQAINTCKATPGCTLLPNGQAPQPQAYTEE